MSALSAFFEATVRTATPLGLAALGEVVVERAGVINISLEGVVLCGAFGAFVGAKEFGLAGGYVVGSIAGVALAAIFAAFIIWVRADQIIAGTALMIFATGITGTLYRGLYGAAGAALSIPTSIPHAIPVLSRIPLVGGAFFNQPSPTYLLYALTGAVWWWTYRTHAGLGVRAIGEAPAAAIAAGIPVSRARLFVVVFGGLMGGLAGATLVLAQAGTFAENMSAGRGFIAIAIVVLGRWNPLGVALAALVFGAASALQFLLQAMGWSLPYQLFLALPYVLTLAALAGVAGRVRAPAALGRTDES